MAPPKRPFPAITLWIVVTLVAVSFGAPTAGLAESSVSVLTSNVSDMISEASPDGNSEDSSTRTLSSESPSSKKYGDPTPKASVIMLTLIFVAFILLLFAVITWVCGWRFWRCTCREMNCCCCRATPSSSKEDDTPSSKGTHDDDKAIGKVALIRSSEDNNEQDDELRVPLYSYLLMAADR